MDRGREEKKRREKGRIEIEFLGYNRKTS